MAEDKKEGIEGRTEETPAEINLRLRLENLNNPLLKGYDPFCEYKAEDNGVLADKDGYLPCHPYLFPFEVTQSDRQAYADDLSLDKIMLLATRSVQLTHDIDAKSYFRNTRRVDVMNSETEIGIQYAGRINNGLCSNQEDALEEKPVPPESMKKTHNYFTP